MQVRIHYDDCVPVSEIQSSGDCGLMAKISAETDYLDAIISECGALQYARRCIRTAIIHKDDFPRHFSKGVKETLQQQRYRLRLI